MDINTLTQNLAMRLPGEISGVFGSEATYVGIIYKTLRDIGLRADQIALELYCNDLTSRPNERPDIEIFDKAIKGQFSNNAFADKNRSNKNAKREHCRAIYEVKGGYRGLKTAIGRLEK